VRTLFLARHAPSTGNAADVVNGVDRASQAYRTAYLATADAQTCNVNLFQNKTASGVATVSLWAANPVQAQACTDAGRHGPSSNGQSASSPGGSAGQGH